MKESIQPKMQPSAHEKKISAQTKDMACWQSKRESMKLKKQLRAHRQVEMSAQTKDMAC